MARHGAGGKGKVGPHLVTSLPHHLTTPTGSDGTRTAALEQSLSTILQILHARRPLPLPFPHFCQVPYPGSITQRLPAVACRRAVVAGRVRRTFKLQGCPTTRRRTRRTAKSDLGGDGREAGRRNRHSTLHAAPAVPFSFFSSPQAAFNLAWPIDFPFLFLFQFHLILSRISIHIPVPQRPAPRPLQHRYRLSAGTAHRRTYLG